MRRAWASEQLIETSAPDSYVVDLIRCGRFAIAPLSLVPDAAAARRQDDHGQLSGSFWSGLESWGPKIKRVRPTFPSLFSYASPKKVENFNMSILFKTNSPETVPNR